MVQISRVEELTSTKNVVIIGSGRSLEGFDFYKLRDQDCFVIAVNDSGN